MENSTKKLSPNQQQEMLATLKNRFQKNIHRHKDTLWTLVEKKLKANPEKLWSLHQMETTGGEPDVVKTEKNTDQIVFFDCSPESPIGRRSSCYDGKAQDARKENKPKHNAMELAQQMGIELLDEAQYRALQELGDFDTKTSSWLKTPSDIRELGGAIFADFRFGYVFVYHNGVQSYYSGRGFRGVLEV